QREHAAARHRVTVDGGDDRDGQLEDAEHEARETIDEAGDLLGAAIEERGKVESRAEDASVAGEDQRTRLPHRDLVEERGHPLEEPLADGIRLPEVHAHYGN